MNDEWQAEISHDKVLISTGYFSWSLGVKPPS
jgi:predicted phosphohydrolase